MFILYANFFVPLCNDVYAYIAYRTSILYLAPYIIYRPVLPEIKVFSFKQKSAFLFLRGILLWDFFSSKWK